MDNYKNELNNLSASARKEYNDLHTLRLLQVKGAIDTYYLSESKANKMLEEILSEQVKKGNVKEKITGWWYWESKVYTLTQLAEEYLNEETYKLVKTSLELNNSSSEREKVIKEKVIKNNGYSPSEYLVKKAILVDKAFDNSPIGFFNQTANLGTYLEGKYSNKVPRTKTQSTTYSAPANTSDDLLFWAIIMSDTGCHHSHTDNCSHSEHDHSGQDFGGSHSSHDFGSSDFGSHDSSSFDSGSFDSGGFDGGGCDGGGF